MPFSDLHLSDALLKAVEDSGYTEPTAIQAAAIPPVLMGKDLIGVAQTGTGKTASFVLPMIDILAEGRSRARMPRSLILEPTRELAAQVAENFEKYGKYHKLTMALLIGGVAFGDQDKALEKGRRPQWRGGVQRLGQRLGPVGWHGALRWRTPLQAAWQLALAGCVAWVGWQLLQWAVLQAQWHGSPADCAAAAGACGPQNSDSARM